MPSFLFCPSCDRRTLPGAACDHCGTVNPGRELEPEHAAAAAPSVRPVEWYDTLIPTSRCVTVQWWPNATEAGGAGPRLGRLYSAVRSSPGEVWPAMVALDDSVTADEARLYAVSRGCVYRVTDSGVQRCRSAEAALGLER